MKAPNWDFPISILMSSIPQRHDAWNGRIGSHPKLDSMTNLILNLSTKPIPKMMTTTVKGVTVTVRVQMTATMKAMTMNLRTYLLRNKRLRMETVTTLMRKEILEDLLPFNSIFMHYLSVRIRPFCPRATMRRVTGFEKTPGGGLPFFKKRVSLAF